MSLVPAQEVTKYMDQLRDLGCGWAAISRETGIDERHLRHIYDQKWVHPSTAARILRVPSTAALDGADVPALGSIRRLRALQVMGWTNAMLGEETGLASDVITYLIQGRRERVKASSVRVIAETFNRLQLTPPTETIATKRARLRAERRGWAPPLAWDEESLDDPNAQPDMSKRKTLQRRPRSLFSEEYRELKDMGLIDERIAERMGITLYALQANLQRYAA